jgi:hypothetical protein
MKLYALVLVALFPIASEAWLKKHGFNTVPDELQKPYLRKGAYFLAVRIITGGEASRMKPLDIAYPAKNLLSSVTRLNSNVAKKAFQKLGLSFLI